MIEKEAALVQLAKKAKKNGVAVDIVNIGVKENIPLLQAFIDNVNNADNSHLVPVDLGVHNVADFVISSAINQGAAPVANEVGNAGVGAVDPSMDPELAEAIRQSLQDQQSMLQSSNAEVKKEEKKEEKKEGKKDEKKEEKKESAPMEDVFENLTEEEIMQRAIALSLEKVPEESKAEAPSAPTIPAAPTPVEAPAKPLQPKETKKEEKMDDIETQLLKSNDFVSELISTLPEMTEQEKMKVLSSLGQGEKKPEEKKEKKKPEEKK